jgi:hypothetical protein
MSNLRWLTLSPLLAIAGCAGRVPARPPAIISIDQLISTPEAFQDKSVVVDACLFVTNHGMSLYNCTYRPGDSNQLVSFDPAPSVNERAYHDLLNSGFEGFAVPKYTVRANISGIYTYRQNELPHYVLLIENVDNVRKIYERDD